MSDDCRSSAPNVEQLVAELEGLWIDPQTATLSSVAELLEKRQELLTTIQNADASQLSKLRKGEVRSAVERVMKRDRELLTMLETRRDEVRKSLQLVAQGRQTARGYRQGRAAVRKPLRSVA